MTICFKFEYYSVVCGHGQIGMSCWLKVSDPNNTTCNLKVTCKSRLGREENGGRAITHKSFHNWQWKESGSKNQKKVRSIYFYKQ